MPRTTLPRIGLAALALGAALTLAPAARADGGTFLVLGLPSIVLGTGGGVTLVHNGVLAGRNERPSTAWLVTGYVFGGLNLAAGAASVICGILFSGVGGSDVIPFYFVGAGALAFGGLGVGLTAWSQSKPRSAGRAGELLQHLAVLPTPLRDARGRLAPGLSLVVHEF